MPELLDKIGEISTYDILNRFRVKKVTLMLKSGGSLTGKLMDNIDYTSPFNRMVHLTELEGQDYFDAVIEKDTVKGFVFRRPGTP